METRPIYQIAQDIKDAWKNPSPYALAYLDPMLTLNSIDDHYYFDDAKSIILYFLANAQGFRGEKARQLKQELKDLLKTK